MGNQQTQVQTTPNHFGELDDSLSVMMRHERKRAQELGLNLQENFVRRDPHPVLEKQQQNNGQRNESKTRERKTNSGGRRIVIQSEEQ
mmetsp:Transcript_3518/g.4892  ORF Transcript_3518/g.4892 Transcript_3518/m.4892 type:complete len:88 (-) Transcript_3518:250-513(-)